jgi:hypothetical protein
VVPNHHSDPTRDGAGTALCVDSTMNASSPAFSYTSHAFVDDGSAQGLDAGTQPVSAAEFCKH